MLTHAAMLRRTASAYGSRVALVGPDGATLSYEQLDELTDRVAGGFRRAGLVPGDVVVWLDQNSVEYLVAYFATAKAGLQIAPLNYWLRASELAPQLELVRPAGAIVGAEFVELMDAALGTIDTRARWTLGDGAPDGYVGFGRLADAPPLGDADRTAVGEDTPHEVIFTSGTTGQAKGVSRTQRQRILDSLNAALAYQLHRDDHMLWFLPQFHIGGASVPNQLLVQGGTVTVLRRFDPADAAKAIATGITYIVGVPAHYNLLFESGVLDAVDTTHVRGCYVGGSVASARLFDDILDRFPNADLVHGYGSTESGPHSMALRGPAFLERKGSLGLPVPGTEVRVVDPATRSIVGRGGTGELEVRSDSVMTEYVGRPDLTTAAFSPDGWLKTGDLVRTDDDGFYYLVDRVKDVIITGGENVYPKEVEDVLALHPTVAEAAVIGVPDDVYEERVVALVRARPDGPPPDADELIAFVRGRLAGYKTPKEVHVVDDFPRTGVGKVAKHELRAGFGSVFRP